MLMGVSGFNWDSSPGPKMMRLFQNALMKPKWVVHLFHVGPCMLRVFLMDHYLTAHNGGGL